VKQLLSSAFVLLNAILVVAFIFWGLNLKECVILLGILIWVSILIWAVIEVSKT
jgi:hypothetical protein